MTHNQKTRDVLDEAEDKLEMDGSMGESVNVSLSNLHHRDLSGEDLQNIPGLNAEHLAGSTLTGAKLPKEIDWKEHHVRIAESSKLNKSVFLLTYFMCIYSLLTIGKTTDIDIVTVSSLITLPIIGSDVPIIAFYVFGPIFLLCAYAYLQLCFFQHLSLIHSLPAVFTDGVPVNRKVFPWIMNNIPKHFSPLLRGRRSFRESIEMGLMVFFVWYLIPLVTIFFWIRYLPSHNWYVSALHLMILVAVIFIGKHYYYATRRQANGGATYETRGLWAKVLVKTVPLLTLVLGIIITDGAINSIGLYNFGYAYDFQNIRVISADKRRATYPHRIWVPYVLHNMGFIVSAEFEYQNLSKQPENYWLIKEEDRLQSIRPVSLKFSDLRTANFAYANLISANLEGTNLDRANLYRANLQNAYLKYTSFREAYLRNANLSGVNARCIRVLGQRERDPTKKIHRDNYRCPTLFGANLEKTIFYGADLIQVAGLTREQAQMSCWDEETRWPPELEMESSNRCN